MKPTPYVLSFAMLIGLLACSNKGDSVKPQPGSQTPADVTDAQVASADDAGAQGAGTAPVLGDDGVPINCPILHDGLCYQDTADACQAAGCPDCSILESYPGQVSCAADAATEESQ